MGHCVINFDADGKFAFNDDFTDIATVTPGGRVVVEVDYGAHDRRVTIQRAGNGVERIYKVDGDVRPFDDEAKAWLTETLTFLLRRTGFMAEERARWILDRRGIQGLIDEFGELTGDYTRRIYYQAAVESGKLDAAGFERLSPEWADGKLGEQRAGGGDGEWQRARDGDGGGDSHDHGDE